MRRRSSCGSGHRSTPSRHGFGLSAAVPRRGRASEVASVQALEGTYASARALAAVSAHRQAHPGSAPAALQRRRRGCARSPARHTPGQAGESAGRRFRCPGSSQQDAGQIARWIRQQPGVAPTRVKRSIEFRHSSTEAWSPRGKMRRVGGASAARRRNWSSRQAGAPAPGEAQRYNVQVRGFLQHHGRQLRAAGALKWR